MLLKHTTKAGKEIKLAIPTEETCYQVTELMNLNREKLQRAMLSTDEVAGKLKGHGMLMASVDDTPVAVTVVKRFDGIVLIQWIATHPDWQRQGIATALLKAVSRGLSGKSYRLRASTPDSALEAHLLFKHLGLQSRVENGNYIFF